MSVIQHALIMAAGRGRRMMPLTQVVPKPMAPYRDSTLIANGISRLRKHINHIHVTVGYKASVLAPHLVEQGVSSILNTGGHPNSWWIYHTLLRHLDQPIFVLTCDNVTDVDFALLEEDYVAARQPAAMLVPARPVPGLEGDFIFHTDRYVTEVSRRKPADAYCSGIQILNPARLNEMTVERGDFYSVWGQLIEARQLMVSSVFPKNWFSVETLEDLERLTGGDAPLTG
jgi:NDP-sugar pyrophosphorylase family protein